tara:strand:- start:992 stop:1330 length:339 start_codon:yes stop_codon:yes gene_type:complete
MLNVTATGNLVADPEQRTVQTSQGNLEVTSFRILVNKKKGQEEIVTAVDCSIWGNKGNAAMAYLKKGHQITIAGAGNINTFTHKNGVSGASIEVNVQEYSLPPKPRVEEMPF